MTHHHHDPVTELPFFGPVHQQGREIHVWCGNPGGASAEAALLALPAPPLFPLTPEQMPARFIVHGFHAGKTLSIGPDRIRVQASIPLGRDRVSFRYERGLGRHHNRHRAQVGSA
jgi:hypothetical protein